jgi:hypothetical protein
MASIPRQQAYPCILACGYREIQSPRTALSFPAWLIQFSPGGRTFWRSKKDFLLLFRATKRSTSKGIPQCPKAALNKLVTRAPWKRPGFEGGDNEESSSVENNYHVSMKRNLFQLDRYLQCIVEHQSDDSDLSKAWQIFSRLSDTQGLRSPGETASVVNNGNATAATPTAIQQGHEKEPVSSFTSTQEGSKLGQYFCSPATAKQIVSSALDFVVKKKWETTKNIIFLEPSCGHGDIVWQLLDDLETTRTDPCNHSIIGCDLDANAIRICQEHEKSDRVMEWRQGDFLKTQPPADVVASSSTVVVLGGPPYTSGAGSGEAMTLDMPNAFLQHCVDVWKASFVAFILPKRYKDSPMAMPGWTVETHELETSTFYFQGDRKVTQPSIIQSYTKEHM